MAWGYVFDGSGSGALGSIVTASFARPQANVRYGEILVSGCSKSDTANADGYWELPVFKASALSDTTMQTRFIAVDSLTHVIGKTTRVIPDSATYRILWR